MPTPSPDMNARVRRIALEREAGRNQAASRDALRSGDKYSAALYHQQAQRLVRLANPLPGDKKTGY